MRRLNGAGAIASLLTGFALGAMRLTLELIRGPDRTGLPAGSLWAWIAGINFLHYALLLFVVCTAVLVGVSLLTPPPDPQRIQDLTFGKAAGARPPVPAWRVDAALSAALAAILVALWIRFA